MKLYVPMHQADVDEAKMQGRYLPTQVLCVRCGAQPIPLMDVWVRVIDGVPTGPSCETCALTWNEHSQPANNAPSASQPR